MNFARTMKMLTLSLTFMGGAVLTPMLTTPAQAGSEIIVAAGPGGGPHVKVYSGVTYTGGISLGLVLDRLF